MSGKPTAVRRYLATRAGSGRMPQLPRADVSLAALLPRQPNPDWLAVMQSAGIEAIWPRMEHDFRDSANATFV